MAIWLDIEKKDTRMLKNVLRKQGYSVSLHRHKTANYGSKDNPRFSRTYTMKITKGDDLKQVIAFWDTAERSVKHYLIINYI